MHELVALGPLVVQDLDGPAFAHAGMVAAARAIFEDMTQRGILQVRRRLWATDAPAAAAPLLSASG